MFDSGYGGEHWLATFAIYNLLNNLYKNYSTFNLKDIII